jgi:putative DNA primase/helicase
MSGDCFRQANYGSLSDTFHQACFDADTRPNKRSNGRNSGEPISLAAPKSRLVTINASSVKPRNIDFIWPGRLARGKHTCFAGEGGLGKSQLLVAITADLTIGGAWPCGEGRAPIVDVVILSAEDGVEDVLVPRLMAAGADLKRVHIVKAVIAHDGKGERRFGLQEDLNELEKKIAEIGDVGLVWIDPVTSYMGKVDSHNNTALRGVLDPISEMAERTNVAFASVTHFTKGSADKGIKAMNRVMGGAAFTTAPRAAFAIIEDPDDSNRRLLLHLKNNLAPKTQGLAFRLGAQMVGIDDRTDKEIWASHILWEDNPVETTADEAVAASAPGAAQAGNAREEAADFLRQTLRGGPVPSAHIWDAAKANGIAHRTLKRAKTELGIKARHHPDLDGGWEWVLLEEGQKLSKGATLESGPLRENLAPFGSRADGVEGT